MWVSIVISSHNYAQYLKNAIDSALAQTHPHVEVVVVDDGSTDGSRKLIRSYGKRILPVFKTNGGQASALNAGFEQSRGDWVLFLDSDDALAPTAAAKAVDGSEAGAAKMHWPLWKMDRDGRKTGQTIPPEPLSSGDFRSVLAHGWPPGYGWPPTSGNIWSRAFLQSVLPIPEAPYQTCPDLYLSILAPAFGPIVACEQPQGFWRVHETNNTWREPLRDRTNAMLERLDCAFRALESHGKKRGLNISRKTWEKAPWVQWLREIKTSIADIDAFLPRKAPFILVDNGLWEAGQTLADRPCLPFVERNGRYWGPPVDSGAAVAELERLRKKGADFIVFTPPALWWLSHYEPMHRHLRAAYRTVHRNSHLAIFDLRT